MFFSNKSEISLKKIQPLRVQSHIHKYQKKRTSQSASKKEPLLFSNSGIRLEDGGVTLEASIIIPLLLCVFVAIILWGKVFLIHQEIETSLMETARQLARQEAFLIKKNQEGTSLLNAGILFSKNRKQGESMSGLEVSAVNLLQSEYRKDTKEIYLRAEYVIKIPLLLLGTWKIPMKTSIVQKAWNGYSLGYNGSEGNGEYVYITEHGTAYHRDSQCYHLHVSVEEVTNVSVYYGGTTDYRPCEFCVSGSKDKNTLYISEDGECYHEDLSCGGLTRTVSYVEIGKTGGRRPCADCGQ